MGASLFPRSGKRPAGLTSRLLLKVLCMQFFTVKNWNEFQHYGKRNPPWIKLHRALLDDYIFCSLPDDAKAHLMLLWVYASQHNGEIPNDPAFLEKKLSCSGINVEMYVDLGFLLKKT